jgi:Immunity protein Imm1
MSPINRLVGIDASLASTSLSSHRAVLIHQFDDGHGIVQPRHCTSALVILGQENTEFDYMVVGGGKDRLYWCGIYDKEGRQFVAVDPSKSSTTYVKVPTGQPTSVPLKETIGLEDAVPAAREYAETGQRTTKLAWEKRK